MNKKICIFLLFMVMLLSGCASVEFENKEPDDVISTAIYEAIGDEFYYLGSNKYTDADLSYMYLIRHFDERQREVLYDVINTVNETIKKEEIKDKVCIIFCRELSGGATIKCIIMKNYSNNELQNPDCEGLQNLMIMGCEFNDCVCEQPMTYIALSNIKYLEIDVEIQERAEKEGIDWFECWPELEKMEVAAFGETYKCKMADDAISNAIHEAVGYEAFYLGKKQNTGAELCYEYYIRDRWRSDIELAEILRDVVTAVNNTIKEENITDLVSINFYYKTEEVVLSLHNYSDSQLEYPDLEGLGRVVILGNYSEGFKYNRPKTYSLLPNIKYLEVKEHIQENANFEGIDWYDYWPDLENIVLLDSLKFPDGKMPDDDISSAVWDAVGDDLKYLGKSDRYRPIPELCYEYYITIKGNDSNKIEDVLADATSAVNITIKEEGITDLVSVFFYIEHGSRGPELVLHLYNYSEYELESPDLNGLEKAIISGCEDKKSEYNNPEIYSLLPNIKYLEVKERVNGRAYDQGIDWYDYWPDLESVEVF